jgi:hypothetical protein
MMKRSTARAVCNDMFASTPPFGLGLKPRSPEFAADRIIRNIETRAATDSPTWT